MLQTYVQLFAAVRELERRMDAPKPVAPLDIPVEEYLARLQQYRELVVRYEPEQTAACERTAAALARATPEVRAQLVRALVQHDLGALYDLAASMDVAADRVLFLGELALRPYLKAYARSVQDRLDPSAVGSGHCPVCGRMAHMGHIDADNIKHLHCPACDTVWRTARVGCPHCGTTDSDQLGYFTLDGDDEHRVEYCLNCGGYMKVVDQRARGRSVDYLLEDAATLHLDQLAQAEGYHK